MEWAKRFLTTEAPSHGENKNGWLCAFGELLFWKTTGSQNAYAPGPRKCMGNSGSVSLLSLG